MVYSFFEPSEAGRSPGTFMILDHIRRPSNSACRISISAIGSMAHGRWTTRLSFKPQERLMGPGWVRVE